MKFLPALACALLLSLSLAAQTGVNPGNEIPRTTSLDRAVGADNFTSNFAETNVGFLHIYVDPEIDPLETYLLRGTEMTEEARAALPKKFRRLGTQQGATFFAGPAVKGIGENLYLVRIDGRTRDQIDMFAVRKGRVRHVKTLAYRDCGNGECLQMDSYLTDVDLDTNLDLIQIARRGTDRAGTTDERRRAFVMSRNSGKWKATKGLDVPWSGIVFFGDEVDPGHNN